MAENTVYLQCFQPFSFAYLSALLYKNRSDSQVKCLFCDRLYIDRTHKAVIVCHYSLLNAAILLFLIKSEQ